MVDNGDGKTRLLRVVALDVGETIHNAFWTGLSRERAMKLRNYPEADRLTIELKAEPGAETRDGVQGLKVDLDDHGEVIGFDIDRASRRRDLTTLETDALPTKKKAA